MSLFIFRTCAFDATAQYNLIPTPPDEQGRAGMRIVSNGIAEKAALFTFPDEQQRDQGFREFVETLNNTRHNAAVAVTLGSIAQRMQETQANMPGGDGEKTSGQRIFKG